jgi:nucleoside-diphosphate-sugar epimerase
MQGIDTVFHCAASVEFGPSDASRLREINVEGTRNVLDAAAAVDALLVHVSSVAALGPTGSTLVDESHWAVNEPTVAYEATKRSGHELARARAADGARVRIGVPGGIYGFGDESSMAKLIELFTLHPTPLGYMPELVQSLVNVDDCADALRRISEQGVDSGEYLLCADAVPFRRWFELIAQGAGRRPPVAHVPTAAVRSGTAMVAALARRIGVDPGVLLETVEIATRHQAFSGRKARHELGWEPRSLAQGMAEMCGQIRLQDERRRLVRRTTRRAG